MVLVLIENLSTKSQLSGTDKTHIVSDCKAKLVGIKNGIYDWGLKDKLPDVNSNDFKSMKSKIENTIYSINDLCNYDLKNIDQGCKLEFESFVNTFLDRLGEFAKLVSKKTKICVDCFGYSIMELKTIFNSFEAYYNENGLLLTDIKEKYTNIKRYIINHQANLLTSYILEKKDKESIFQCFKNLLDAFESFGLSSNVMCKNVMEESFKQLITFLNNIIDAEQKNEFISKINEFMRYNYPENKFDFMNKERDLLYKFIQTIKDLSLNDLCYIYEDGKIGSNTWNDILMLCFNNNKYLNDGEYIGKKIDYIKQRIESFNQAIKDIKTNSKDINTGIGNIILDIKVLEYNLQLFWNDCNELFYSLKANSKKTENSDDLKKYSQIVDDRAKICDVFRDLEVVKQKLLQQETTNKLNKNHVKLSKFEKFFRTCVVVITFPIHFIVFISVKTLKKLFRYLVMGLEPIYYLYFLIYKIFKDGEHCKDIWAEQYESRCFDGLKINNKDIYRRMQWYETKRWLFWRRILFPINLVCLMIIGIFSAIKKFFKSIVKFPIIWRMVVQNIWVDNPTSYIFTKNRLYFRSYGEIICNMKNKISVLPNNIKISNKFVDMSCPRTSYVYFSDSKFWNHWQCLIGLKSIKSVKHWNEYAHEHHIPRLRCDNCYENETIVGTK